MTQLFKIVETSQRVTATSSRSGKVRELIACLRELTRDEIEVGVLYLTGETRQGRFGLGYAALRTASVTTTASASSLEIGDVDARLAAIAEIRGAGSTTRRATALNELFALATTDEQHFLIRLLMGELRQGAQTGVMVDAIAGATQLPIDQVRRAAMYESNLGALAKVGFAEGIAGLERFDLQVLSPIVPMLAQTAADVDEALEKLHGDVAFEWKMDGARIQVHKQADLVRIYTRNLNDVTPAIPEIVAAVRELPAQELVLDGEAIAFDAAGRPYPFQTTMRRFGRKLDVERMQVELPMQAFYFDCLRLNERTLAQCSAAERFAVLAGVVPSAQLIPRLVTRSSEQARSFYDAALAQGHEGVMAKALDSPYEAGNRGSSWLKIKRAHTLDLIVLAAEWGHGRRTGKLSNLHLGALDTTVGQYVMLGKTFKGLTDAMLAWQTRELLARETHRDQWTVYVRPELVVEIAFSDLQASTRYPGGVSLRLARVKRYREDKRADEADTMESLQQIFAAQSQSPIASR